MTGYARGPGHQSRTGGPLVEAYADSDALTRPCPTCHVAVREWCINPITGGLARTPCVARLTPDPEEAA